MDREEYLNWQAYFALDPFGEERADYRAGIIAATIANVHRAKGQKAFTPPDFMPRFGGERTRGARPQTPAQMLAVFRMFTRAAGGTINGVPAAELPPDETLAARLE
jgi:Protein of unknown function (DUF4035)